MSFPVNWIPGNLFTVPPGASQGASINQAIANASAAAAALGISGAKVDVYLGEGLYYLETAIVAKSNVRLRGVGDRTILVPQFTGGGDTNTNAVIVADSAINTAKANTTLTTKITKNLNTTAVASTGTLAADDYILVQGYNTPSEDGGIESDGTSVILSEVMQVSSVSGGVTIVPKWPWRQCHGTTAITVRGVTPIVGFEVRDLQIWGSTGSYVTAVGVFARYCVDFTVSGLTMSGASRYCVDLVGVKQFRVSNFRGKGNNNGWLQCTSCISGFVDGFNGDQGVARVHASGFPRYPIWFRSRCTDVDARDIHITGMSSGMYVSGGEHIRVTDFEATDIQITADAVYDRYVASGEIDTGTRVVLGFGTGAGPIALAELCFDFQVGFIRCEDMRVPYNGNWTTAPFKACGAYFHDVVGGSVQTVHVINRGDTGDQTLVAGVVVSDYSGMISRIKVNGHYYGIVFENSANSALINSFEFDGRSANSPNVTIPIYVNHSTPSAETIHIGEAWLTSASSAFRAGGTFAGDSRFSIGKLLCDSSGSTNEWTDLIIGAIDADYATGDVLEIDATHTDNTFLNLITPVAGFRRLAALATGDDIAGSSYVLCCTLPARLATVNATATAIVKGDPIEYSGTRNCATNAASLAPFGTSLTKKAAGAGKIRVCMPSGYGGAA